jgi:hypothetical protein
LKETNLTFSEVRDSLLAHIKEDNNFTSNNEKLVFEIRKNIDKHEKKMRGHSNIDENNKRSE